MSLCFHARPNFQAQCNIPPAFEAAEGVSCTPKRREMPLEDGERSGVADTILDRDFEADQGSSHRRQQDVGCILARPRMGHPIRDATVPVENPLWTCRVFVPRL